MIKIQARMVVIPHTMAVCLPYSMQAPGLFVPGLSACERQGLFTFSPGLRKQAAYTFMLHGRGEFWTAACFTSTLHKPQSSATESLSFFCPVRLPHSAPCRSFIFSSLYSCPRGEFHLHKNKSQTGLNVRVSSSTFFFSFEIFCSNK